MRPRPYSRSVVTKRPSLLHFRCLYSSPRRLAEPLRILFCGADEFSVASLRALNKEWLANSNANIESIDVVCRPGKPTGSGLKFIRHLPIRETAHELDLPLHEIDTFTGWQPPLGINLIVAVSFGLLVPPRILESAQYGGLNIHPSRLPDLRGPAPIHHTILKNRRYTGITLQTLHPSKMDHGIILSQTPWPGIKVPEDATTASLTKLLAPEGAQMLVRGLKDRVFETLNPIIPTEAQIVKFTGGDGLATAPKITPQDRQILEWSRLKTHRLLRLDRALGNLWDTITYRKWATRCWDEFGGDMQSESIPSRRIIFSGGFEKIDVNLQTGKSWTPELRTGFKDIGALYFLPGKKKTLVIVTANQNLVRVKSCTIEGGKKENGIEELWGVFMKYKNFYERRQKKVQHCEKIEIIGKGEEIGTDTMRQSSDEVELNRDRGKKKGIRYMLV